MTVNPFNKFLKRKEFLFPYGCPIARFPFYVDIEITNSCNLNCVMCRRQIMKRDVGYMQENIFRRIIDEVANFKDSCGVRFCRQGEPILHRQLADFIGYANAKKVLNYVSTNGYYSKDKIIEIIHAQPSIIRFSFQGLERSEFERYRVPAKYDIVADNIKIAFKEKEKMGSETPYLIIGATITGESMQEVARFKKEWEEIVDAIEIGKTTFSWLETIKRVSEFVKEESLKRQYKPCTEVTTKLSVNWNGDICACCSDQDGHFVLGNITKMSLREAWNCEKENFLRSMVGKTLRHAELPHCKHCYTENYKFDTLKQEFKKEPLI